MENDEKEKLKHENDGDVKQKIQEVETQSVENSQPDVDAAEVTQKAEEKQSLTSKTNKTQQGNKTEKQETAEEQKQKVENNQAINAEKEQVPEDEDNNNEDVDLNIDNAEDDEFDSESEISPEAEKEAFDSQDSVQAETQQTLDHNGKLEQNPEFQQDADAEFNADEEEVQEFDTDADIPEDAEKDAIETEQYPEIDSNSDGNVFDEDFDIDAEKITSEDNGANTSHSLNSKHTSKVSRKRFSLADVFVPLLFIVILLSFGITASVCAFPKYTQKDAIEYYMSYLDFSMKQSIADSEDDGVVEDFYDLLFSTGDDAKYNVIRILQNGDYTYVDVDVKYPDHTEAYNQTYNDVVAAHNYDPISDEDLYRQMAEEFEVNLALEENSYTHTNLRFRCYQVGKCWVVDTYYIDGDALANVLTGNVFELFTEM